MTIVAVHYMQLIFSYDDFCEFCYSDDAMLSTSESLMYILYFRCE